MSLKEVWESGIQSEVDFWRSVLSGSIPEYDAYRAETLARLDPARQLEDYVAALCPSDVAAKEFRILDVAAGPVSSVGWRIGGEAVQLVPIDALAPQYRAILAEFDITPPVWTEHCDGEEMASKFAPGSFDVVHIRNALDHCYEPVSVIRNAFTVLKPGGALCICGHTDEAEYGKYDGLHQWNVRVESDDMIIWRPGERYEVGRIFATQINRSRCQQWDDDRWTSALFWKLIAKN